MGQRVRAQRAGVVRARALGVTFGAWLREWIELRAGARYNVKSERVMARTHVAGDALGRADLATLTRAALREWWARMASKPARVPRQMPLPLAGVAPPPKGLSASTLRNVLTLIRCALADAVARGLLDANPADGLSVPRPARASTELELDGVLEPAEQSALTRTLAARIWSAKSEAERVEARAVSAMVRVALGTGLRRGELLSLRWEDVELAGESPHLRVRFGGRGRATKGGRARRVPLFGVALEALAAWRELGRGVDALRTRDAADIGGLRRGVERGAPARHDPKAVQLFAEVEVYGDPSDHGVRYLAREFEQTSLRASLAGKPFGLGARAEVGPSHGGERSALVFPGPRGGRRKLPPVRELRAALRAAGVARRVRWHDLRHACATSLLEGWWGRRWSAAEVQQLLGHASIATTERYVHARGSLVFRAAREARGAVPSPHPELRHLEPVLSTSVDTLKRHLASTVEPGVAVEPEARPSVGMVRGRRDTGEATERDTGLESERRSWNPCDD